VWVRKGRQPRIQMKEIVNYLAADDDSLKINPRKVGEIIRNTLNVTVEHRGGNAWLLLDAQQGLALGKRYGVTVENYGPSVAAVPGSPGVPLPSPALPTSLTAGSATYRLPQPPSNSGSLEDGSTNSPRPSGSAASPSEAE